MQAVQQIGNSKTGLELKKERIEEVNCSQIKALIETLVQGKFLLETASRETKRNLFRHLESCQQCCRSFDARLRYSSFTGRSLY